VCGMTPNLMHITITCIAFIAGLGWSESQEVVSVQIEQAVVNGVIEGRNGQREYYAFKGIQYATAERWKVINSIEIISFAHLGVVK